MQSLSQFGFRTLAIVCDGASSNLAAMKILCGLPNKALSNECDALDDSSYLIKASFVNPYDVDDIPVFVVICPTYQLKNMISALASSHPGGNKSFISEGVPFGWEAIKKVYEEDMGRAQRNQARLVPGLKYSYIERDSWTKLNVLPAKIMQQRYMLAALRSLAEESPSSQAILEKTAQYLEACHMIFERGILSHKLVKSVDCQVINNIKNGFQFFQEWCYEHENRDYPECTTKSARNRKFLAWQTWDLLRMMVSGFTQLTDWFTDHLPGYYICPLRINGSALESIFSILKFASGGNLSALTYGPSLGRHINRKDLALVQNPNSENGYRNASIVTADGPTTVNSLNLLPTVFGTARPAGSGAVTEYLFPSNISQATLGGRIGSNACTVIAVLSGFHLLKHGVHVDVVGNLLSEKWCSSLINSIVEGNRVHDFVYAGAPVDIDCEDVVETFGSDIHVQTVDDTEYFVVKNTDSSELCNIVRNRQLIQETPAIGILIGNQKSSCIYIDVQGNLALIDSHKHREKGAVIFTAGKANLQRFVKEIINMHQRFFNKPLLYGAVTWLHYCLSKT